MRVIIFVNNLIYPGACYKTCILNYNEAIFSPQNTLPLREFLHGRLFALDGRPRIGTASFAFHPKCKNLIKDGDARKCHWQTLAKRLFFTFAIRNCLLFAVA